MTETLETGDRLRDVEALIGRVRTFEKDHTTNFQNGFERIRAETERLRALADAAARESAPEFNIFRLTGITRLEVTTHSAMLADLLDPHGSHGQGVLFLRDFLGLRQIGIDTNDDVLRKHWRVHQEKATAFGNLDLLLYSDHDRVCIVIENKIGAIDQPGQLSRYYRWMCGSGYNMKRSRLIYLTPDKSKPDEGESLCDESGNLDLKAKAKVKLMSYNKDIAKWLTRCKAQCEANRLVAVLDQYIEVIRTIGRRQ